MSRRETTAVILIGHGSRIPGASGDMEKVAARLSAAGAWEIVETCHMSRVGPFLPETLEMVVKKGADRIIVIPYFLHAGLHIVLDIPLMIQREAGKYPGVRIVYGGTLGYDDALVEIVRRRIEEAENNADIRDVRLGRREEYPLPEGEMEFVPMPPEEAKAYMEKHGHDHHH